MHNELATLKTHTHIIFSNSVARDTFHLVQTCSHIKNRESLSTVTLFLYFVDDLLSWKSQHLRLAIHYPNTGCPLAWCPVWNDSKDPDHLVVTRHSLVKDSCYLEWDARCLCLLAGCYRHVRAGLSRRNHLSGRLAGQQYSLFSSVHPLRVLHPG